MMGIGFKMHCTEDDDRMEISGTYFPSESLRRALNAEMKANKLKIVEVEFKR